MGDEMSINKALLLEKSGQKIDLHSGEDVDVAALIRRRAQRDKALPPAVFGPARLTYSNEKPNEDLKSFFFDPLALETNYYGNVRTISPYYGRPITCRILRRVSEKAWIINLCIATTIKQARPYFKETTEENQRGFRIRNRKAVESKRDMTDAEKKEARRLAAFFMNTGDIEDPNRTDDLDKYATKIIRDIYQLDQISTELQRTRGGEICAFWAVDTATIEVALPNTERMTGVKYAQVINHVPYAYYGREDLIFDCMNPRTDIEKAGYGYSVVEQAIDLVTSSINTFMYNAGFFTENKLPRGILLLNGSADQDEIEDIEDYIANLMSGPPTSQWRVPIIPTGRSKNAENGGGRLFEWVNLQGTSKEMEFPSWYDLLLSGVVAMFGKSMEELGLHSQKSQALIGLNVEPRIETSKSLGLGDLLTFLQKHFDQILRYKNPAYVFEFVGYEKDDPKLTLDIMEGEVRSVKALNEKRSEMGLEALDITKIKNPADLPMNPQVIQAWQSLQGMGGMGGDSPFDMGEDDFEESGDGEDAGGGDGEEDPEEAGKERGGTEQAETGGESAGGGGWDEIEAQHGGAAVKKSLGSVGTVRIVI
ncbi:MAG: phage portal protein [Spirochaetaceae bacterium]|jgi:hypothetical protein|nr:phage portal protein [Spirochaetaceae bacterium]